MNIKHELKPTNTVKIANELNLAKYNISALGYDIVHTFLTQLSFTEELDSIPTYEVKLSEVEKLLGKRIKSVSLRKIKEELRLEDLEVFMGSKERLYSWCSYIEFDKDTKALTFKMNPDLKPFLLNLENRFVLLDIKHISKIKGFVGKRLYSILKQYQSQDKNGNGYFVENVEKFKELFKLTEGCYERYSNLKKRILIPAINQINESSDIQVKLIEIKNGRKVERIKFIFTSKENNKKSEHKKTYNKAKPAGAINAIDSLKDWLSDEEVIETEPLQQIA